MPYGELVSRSLAIAWRHRYLWLLAFLAGAAPAASGFQLRPSAAPSQASTATFGDWITAHGGLLEGLAAGFAAFAVVFFVVSCAATGALVRSSAELDAERAWSHGTAWRAGLESFWAVLGLRLLAFLYGLFWLGVLGALFALGVAAVGNRAYALLAVIALVGLVLLVIAVGLSVWLSIGYELGIRSVVLGGLGPLRGLRHGLWLLSQRPGRVLVVWLLSIGLGWAAGIVLAVVAGIVEIAPSAALAQSFAAGNWDGLLGAGLVAIGLGVLVALVPGGLAGAFLSTYWTLAFRRMEWP